MKKCELCGGAARMYCESDQASLCLDCDEKVHGANFLVAKHTRCLLCQACQSVTPWKASGPKLGPTVSICNDCVSFYSNNRHQQHQKQPQQQPQQIQSQETNSHEHDPVADDTADEEEEEEESSDDEDEEYSDEEDELYSDEAEEAEEEEEEDTENQVVPMSGDSLPAPPPIASSSSSMSSNDDSFAPASQISKRMREKTDLVYSDDDIGCSSSQLVGQEANSLRPVKKQRITELNQSSTDHHDQTRSKSTIIIQSLNKLQEEVITDPQRTSSFIFRIRNMSRNHNR